MREPSLLVPYPGPDPSGTTFDSYVYLRPETNGVLTESVLMKTIRETPEWREGARLVYMANYPGDFIQTRHLVEHHYRLKLSFARHGGAAFTEGMRREFERKFGEKFDPERVLGSFEALGHLGIDEEELFGYRVGQEDMLVVLGQNVKRYGNLWVVNYDIPAILHKNAFDTDIAVMVFRIGLSWEDFRTMVGAMSAHLVEAGVIGKDTAPSRAFHHSKSPWEQLLDGIDFLWGADVSDGGVEDDISFGAYMMDRGVAREELRETIKSPLVVHAGADGSESEANLFELTAGMNYAAAASVLSRITRRLNIPSD